MVTLQEKRAETVLLYRYFKNKFVIINFKHTFSIIIVNKMIKIFLLKKVIYLTTSYYFKNLEIIRIILIYCDAFYKV